MARSPLTVRRLVGLDRSGPPPRATLPDQPLNPWTVPNLILFARLALIPPFLILAFVSGDGRSAAAALTFAVIGGADYLDGLVARLTGQFSRLGALADPLVDRVFVLSGVAVTWHFHLLPRWALALLAARELLMLALTQAALRRGVEPRVSMLGRWAVWPTMFSLFLAMVSDNWMAEALLVLGLAMSLAATARYVLDWRASHPEAPSSSD